MNFTKRIKQFISICISLTLICGMLCALPIAVSAESGTYVVLSYEVANGEVTVTDCEENASGEIEIPVTVDGYPVTSIGSNAFNNCSSLTSVNIPDSVTSIGSWAFSGCSSLTNIDIPDCVMSIGYGAFWECSGLVSIAIPNSVTNIEGRTFFCCSGLVSVDIPDGLTNIGMQAFLECNNLLNVIIPDGVTRIEDSAFYGCSSLASIVIPDSVTNIENYAFQFCGNISHVLYSGTEDEWNGIVIGDYNNDLIGATRHYEANSSAISLVSEASSSPYSERKLTYHCSICNGDFITTLPPEINPAKNYTDVKEGVWYYEAVNYALANNLFNGTSPTTFVPDVTMTRGMLVQVLYNLEGKPTITNKNIKFTDVKEKDWFADAVIWANVNGVVDGMTPTTFEPNGKITREQMTTILYRYANFKGYDVSASEVLTKFPDGNKVSSYAVDSLKWAVGAGLISGNKIGGGDMLDARGSATRAQVAKILRGFCENVAK